MYKQKVHPAIARIHQIRFSVRWPGSLTPNYTHRKIYYTTTEWATRQMSFSA